MTNRGYCGIGIDCAKSNLNIGTLFRSSFCFGADFIFTINKRYTKQKSDTPKAWRHLPLYHYRDVNDFIEHLPYDCKLIGVEILPEAENLVHFVHPERAIYLLGAEDVGLSENTLKMCHHKIQIGYAAQCLNVAIAGSIILYDRITKLNNRLI